MRKLLNSIRSFHEDEDGLEALQVVMIVAIGAVVLLAIIKLWQNVIKPWFEEEGGKVADFKS